MSIRLDEARIRLLNINGGIHPTVNNTYNLGTSSLKFANMYATTFHGALDGNANTATALTSSAGSTTQPIYFSNGKPVAITGNIANGTTGNAATATKATQDADGNTISSTYLKCSGGTMTGDLVVPSLNTAFKFNNSDIPENTANLAYTAVAHTMTFYRNGITIPYQMDDSNDGGIIRVRGTSENNCIFELGTWDDSGDGETIQFNYYPTTSQVTPTYSVTVPKKSGTIALVGDGDAGFVKKSGDTMTGNLTVPTVIGNLSGNATTATKATQDGNGNVISSTYLPLSGGTMSGQLTLSDKNLIVYTIDNEPNTTYNYSHHALCLGYPGNDQINWYEYGGIWNFYQSRQGTLTKLCHIDSSGIHGAVWNDYAEFREANKQIKPGRVVIENGDDTLSLSSGRLQAGANIVSDTYGFAIGETSRAQTPIAVSGRVLAYPYEPRDSFSAGDAVCSGPNGTVSKMTRDEIIMYPERIIGTVSAIPDYEVWGTGNVPVDGRIWIKVI